VEITSFNSFGDLTVLADDGTVYVGERVPAHVREQIHALQQKRSALEGKCWQLLKPFNLTRKGDHS
jgi:hypothetical protein